MTITRTRAVPWCVVSWLAHTASTNETGRLRPLRRVADIRDPVGPINRATAWPGRPDHGCPEFTVLAEPIFENGAVRTADLEDFQHFGTSVARGALSRHLSGSHRICTRAITGRPTFAGSTSARRAPLTPGSWPAYPLGDRWRGQPDPTSQFVIRESGIVLKLAQHSLAKTSSGLPDREVISSDPWRPQGMVAGVYASGTSVPKKCLLACAMGPIASEHR